MYFLSREVSMVGDHATLEFKTAKSYMDLNVFLYVLHVLIAPLTTHHISFAPPTIFPNRFAGTSDCLGSIAFSAWLPCLRLYTREATTDLTGAGNRKASLDLAGAHKDDRHGSRRCQSDATPPSPFCAPETPFSSRLPAILAEGARPR